MLRFTGAEHRELVEELLAAYDEAASGAPARLVVLAGEAGSGKTRIVQEFYRALAESQEEDYWPANGLDTEDAEFIKGRKQVFPNRVVREALPGYMWWAISCQQGTDGDPIQVLSDDQTQLEQHCGPILEAVMAREDAVERVKSVLITGLGTFFPLVGWLDAATGIGSDLKALVADVRASNPRISAVEEVDANDNERAELVDGLFQFVSVVASPDLPTVIVVDDAHDADPSCIKLLRQILAPDTGLESVLVVATAWASKLGEESPEGSFGRLVPDLEASGVAERRYVPPLTDEDIRAILDEVAPSVSDDLASAMRDRTDGNPLVLNGVLDIEWISDSLADGEFSADDLRNANVPSTATDVFRNSWKEMPDSTRDALALSSLQGFRFLAELTELAAENREGAVEASSSLASAIDPYGWAEEAADAYRFAQVDFQEIASEHCKRILRPDDRKAALRSGVIWLRDWLDTATIGSVDREIVALSVALYAGGQLDLDATDPEREGLQEFLVTCSRRLVSRQSEKGLPDDCIRTMKDGHELAAKFYGPKAAETLSLCIDWGWICRDLGRYGEGIRFFEVVRAASESSEEFEEQAREGLSCLFCDDGNHEDSLGETEWLIGLYGQAGRSLEVLLIYRSNRAIQNRCLGHGGDRQLSLLAVEEMREVNEIRARAGLPLGEPDHLELALSEAEYEFGPESIEAFEAGLKLGLSYLSIPSIAQADYHLERALAISEGLPVPPEKMLQLQVAKATVEYQRGRIGPSKQHFDQARGVRDRLSPDARRLVEPQYETLATNLGEELV